MTAFELTAIPIAKKITKGNTGEEGFLKYGN